MEFKWLACQTMQRLSLATQQQITSSYAIPSLCDIVTELVLNGPFVHLTLQPRQSLIKPFTNVAIDAQATRIGVMYVTGFKFWRETAFLKDLLIRCNFPMFSVEVRDNGIGISEAIFQVRPRYCL